MEKTIELCGRKVQYSFQRKKVKNINLRIKLDGLVTVSANSRVPVRAVENFIRSKESYIISALERFEAAAVAVPVSSEYADGERLCLFGEIVTLRIRPGSAGVHCLDGELVLYVRGESDAGRRERILSAWLRKRCVETVTELCREQYAAFADSGMAFPELKFRRMSRRWGSCMPQKNILTFNTALVGVPISCIEFVVAHEFTHFLRPDHSSEFYKKLTALMPDWPERKKLLSNYAPLLR